MEYLRRVGDLERELEVFRNKCNGLCVELEEKKMEIVGFEAKLEELAQYKIMYNGIKQQTTRLEEDRRLVCQSENKAQEWIAYLSEEMRKMENRCKLKIRDLESEKRSVENENEGLKKRFKELGIEFSRQKHGVQVERGDMEKYAELEIKIRDLECGKRRVENENDSLKKRVTELGIELSRHKHEKIELQVQYRMTLDGLKQQKKIRDLESEKRSVEDEKESEKRHKHEVHLERHDREKYAELEIKIRDLECGKKRVEDENESLKRRVNELGIEFSRHNHEVQVEKVELEDRRKKYSELSMELETRRMESNAFWTKYSELSMQLEMKRMECNAFWNKFGALMVRKVAVEDELKKCKTVCNELKEKITCIEKDQSILRGRETKAQETIAQLSEELKKKEHDKSGIYFQFKNNERELEECRKKIEEAEIWKKKCNVYKITCKSLKEQISQRQKMAQPKNTNLSEELKEMEGVEKEKYDQLKAENQDLEFQKSRDEDESGVLRTECSESHISGVIESEPGGLQTEVSQNDGKDDRNKMIKLQSEAYGADINGSFVVHATGAPSMHMQSLPVVNVEEDLVFGKEFGKQFVLGLQGTNEMQYELELGSIKPASGRIIKVSDDSSDNSSVKEKDLAPKKCLKRLYSDQGGEICGSRCNEDSLFTSSPKRKRVSESPNASCGGLNVEEKNDWAERSSPIEHTSLTQLGMSGKFNEKMGNQIAEKGKEKMEEEVGSDSEDESLGGFKLEGSDSSDSGYISSDSDDSVNLHLAFDNALKKIYGSRCNDNSPFTSSPKRERASESPNASCGVVNVEEKNSWAGRTSPNEHTSLTQLDMSGKSNEKVGNQTAEKGEEKTEEEVGSDSKDESLGGFKLEGWIFNNDNQSNLKVGNYISSPIRKKKNPDIFMDGAIMDFSQVPSPVCSCTGVPRQCHRWGAGGWQSICCTTNLSIYPLPMNSSRPRGRLAGRKMSGGAYGKLLQRLAAEGYNLAHAVDLKDHWAKHGTNRFITIK